MCSIICDVSSTILQQQYFILVERSIFYPLSHQAGYKHFPFCSIEVMQLFVKIDPLSPDFSFIIVLTIAHIINKRPGLQFFFFHPFSKQTLSMVTGITLMLLLQKLIFYSPYITVNCVNFINFKKGLSVFVLFEFLEMIDQQVFSLIIEREIYDFTSKK